MRRNAVFRGVVHLPRADLHLKRDAFLADDGRVQRLVHVLLRRGDIILKAVRQRREHVVHNAEHVVAVDDRVNDDAQGEHVVDLVEALALNEHLAVNAVDALDAPLDVDAGNQRLHAAADQLLRALYELLAPGAARLEVLLDLMVGDRVEVF